jgi:hypothetical protein
MKNPSKAGEDFRGARVKAGLSACLKSEINGDV